MVVALVTIFIVGYFFIAMEHPFKINKTATALALGTSCGPCSCSAAP